jgi:hypothetical protein
MMLAASGLAKEDMFLILQPINTLAFGRGPALEKHWSRRQRETMRILKITSD